MIKIYKQSKRRNFSELELEKLTKEQIKDLQNASGRELIIKQISKT